MGRPRSRPGRADQNTLPYATRGSAARIHVERSEPTRQEGAALAAAHRGPGGCLFGRGHRPGTSRVRHSVASSCPHVAKGNRWIRCHCPIWVQGSIGGESIRRSLNTTNWTAASSVVHQWHAAGQIGVLKPEIPTVVEAVAKFLAEAAVRNLAATTIQKRR